ncbi:MAG TPA: plasmid pRiA4b ORF-3 family protein, partial [Humibacillus sp.]|nr:plasmid pRiA4b ORF-3 family protein [Humibacillus sp.]
IPGDLDLGRVHDALQQAMGWTDSHLHRFSLGDPYGSPHFVTEYDVDEGEEGTLETDARLDQVLREPGDGLTYEYDFGDGWTHTLRLESFDPMPAPAASGAGDPSEASSAAYPLVCVAGERACPPEDVGGVPGYEDAAAWVRGGEDPAAHLANGLSGEEMRAWLPEGWHPDHLDLDEINAGLARLEPRDTDAVLAQLPREVTEVITRLSTAARFEVDDWLAAPGWDPPETFTDEEAAALTTPYRTVLEAVGDELTLTAAGYLPPAVVEAIYRQARLEDEWIGKGNREDLTWPVLSLRERTRRYGLIRKAKGRLLPTALGRRLRDDAPALLDLVLTRLALEGQGFERVATGLVLLGVAGGAPLGDHLDLGGGARELDDAVCRVLATAGWRTGDGHPLHRDHVRGATRDALDVVRQMVRCVDGDEARADLGRRMARAIIRRMV